MTDMTPFFRDAGLPDFVAGCPLRLKCANFRGVLHEMQQITSRFRPTGKSNPCVNPAFDGHGNGDGFRNVISRQKGSPDLSESKFLLPVILNRLCIASIFHEFWRLDFTSTTPDDQNITEPRGS